MDFPPLRLAMCNITGVHPSMAQAIASAPRSRRTRAIPTPPLGDSKCNESGSRIGTLTHTESSRAESALANHTFWRIWHLHAMGVTWVSWTVGSTLQ